jgi:hypothetical protein
MKVFLLFLVLASAELWVVEYEHQVAFLGVHPESYSTKLGHRVFESREEALTWINDERFVVRDKPRGFKFINLVVVDVKKLVTIPASQKNEL